MLRVDGGAGIDREGEIDIVAVNIAGHVPDVHTAEATLAVGGEVEDLGIAVVDHIGVGGGGVFDIYVIFQAFGRRPARADAAGDVQFAARGQSAPAFDRLADREVEAFAIGGQGAIAEMVVVDRRKAGGGGRFRPFAAYFLRAIDLGPSAHGRGVVEDLVVEGDGGELGFRRVDIVVEVFEFDLYLIGRGQQLQAKFAATDLVLHEVGDLIAVVALVAFEEG